MGVINVTPDSFSDGGEFDSAERAIERGHALVAEGADLLDIGGESTRPGSHRVSADEELRRVIDVIAELAGAGLICSVDTTRASVAAAAIEAGAAVINDVSGGLADPEMAAVVADAGVPWVLMHWRGHSADMYAHATYDDASSAVRTELLAAVERAVAAGVAESALILDPGIGFAKTSEHNWQLLAALPDLVSLGLPVLLGTSRKRFLGELLATGTEPAPPARRDVATAATSLLAAEAGVWAVRAHEVRATADALAVWRRVRVSGSACSPTGPLARLHGTIGP